MLKSLLASTFIFVSASVASAADVVTEPTLSSYDWTGLYIGAHVGGAFGSYTQFSASGTGVDVDVDGVIGGVAIGYNWQFGNIVAGIEADIQNGPKGETAQGTAGPFWSCNTGACNVDIQYYGTLRARLGFAADRALIYATGGLAYGGVDGGIFNSAQQGSGTATGYAVGGGLEYAFTDNWLVKGEYMFVDLGDIPFGTGVAPTEAFEGDGSFSTIKLGVSYKF